VFLAKFFEDFTGGRHAAGVGGIEAAINAGQHLRAIELFLEFNDPLFQGNDSGFKFGDSHKSDSFQHPRL